MKRLEIGQPVRVLGQAGGLYGQKGLWHRRTIEEWGVERDEGLITGGRYRCEGNRNVGTPPGYECDGEGPSFTVTRRVFLYEVRQSFAGRPIECFPHQVIRIEELSEPLVGYGGRWFDQDRKDMSDEMSSWPRDERGRWLKQ